MSSFEVTKLYKVVIQASNVLDDYYKLKNVYDESVQKKNKRKCIHCQKVYMTSLVFHVSTLLLEPSGLRRVSRRPVGTRGGGK